MSERADTATNGPTATADEAAPADQSATPEEALAAERAKVAQYLDSLQRERADFLNFKRRIEADRAEAAALANSLLLTKLLPVLDDFDLALANLPAEARGTSWLDGIAIIQRKLLRTLESEGVTPIDAQGQRFDPNLHEAVMMDDGASEPHTVVAELRRGYRLRDRVLRPTLVKVGDKAE